MISFPDEHIHIDKVLIFGIEISNNFAHGALDMTTFRDQGDQQISTNYVLHQQIDSTNIQK